MATGKAIKESPDKLRAIQAARREGTKFIYEHTDEAIQILSKIYAPLPPNAELTAELEAQKTITAELRAIQARMAGIEKQAQAQYGALVNETAETVRLRRQLEEVGLKPARSAEATLRLTELRRSYEPYILGLSHRLLMPAPSWLRRTPVKDNWQTSPKGAAGAHW